MHAYHLLHGLRRRLALWGGTRYFPSGRRCCMFQAGACDMAASSSVHLASQGAEPAAPPGQVEVAQEGGDCDKEVEAVPHTAIVVIDTLPDGDQLLLHQVTLGRKKLPAGAWELEFAEDGFAIAVDSSNDEACIVIEEMLDKVLCMDKGGRLYIHLVERHGAASTSYSLSEKRSRHEQ